jgi:predicted  nucleic acid-binding Zn-ribbon protein
LATLAFVISALPGSETGQPEGAAPAAEKQLNDLVQKTNQLEAQLKAANRERRKLEDQVTALGQRVDGSVQAVDNLSAMYNRGKSHHDIPPPAAP